MSHTLTGVVQSYILQCECISFYYTRSISGMRKLFCLCHGYRKDVWQLPLDGDFDAPNSQLNDVDVGMNDVDVGVSDRKIRSTTWDRCWYELKRGTSERKVQGCPFTGAAWGVNKSDVVFVNKDGTLCSVLLSI